MASSASGSGGSQGPPTEERRTYFWCHQCQARTATASDFTCGSCGSGFVEELTEEVEANPADGEDSWDDDDYAMGDDQMSQLGLDPIFEHFFSAAVNSSQPRGPGGRMGPTPRRGRRLRIHGRPQVVMGTGDQFLQMLLSNLTGVQMGGGGFVPVMPLYGNPGDYAWGRGGLDAVVTSLLNQMEGAGPAPMPTDNIGQIPKVKISKSQVDAKLQCSVCWDDFSLDEEALKLNCDHIFHSPCIVPWLKLHATCPVCRKSQHQPDEHEARASELGSASASDILGPLFGPGTQTTTSSFTLGPISTSGPSTAAAPEAAPGSLGSTISTVFNHLFGIPSPSTTATPSTSTASTTSSSSTSSGATNQASRRTNPPDSDKNDSFRDMDLE